MSLPELVCCRQHRLRTCLAWDDMKDTQFWSYGYFCERVAEIACLLRAILMKTLGEAQVVIKMLFVGRGS